MFFISLIYGVSLACFVGFFAMQLRLRVTTAYMARTAQVRQRKSGSEVASRGPLKVVMLHPDLGIGGAERLIVDAAVGLQRHQKQERVEVVIVTTHHDRKRAFTETTDGTVSVVVRGDFLPRSLLGRLHVLCATLRMVYAALCACWTYPDADCFIVDQVAAVMPVLRRVAPCTPVLFYCHFPDLRCDANRNEDGSFKTEDAGSAHRGYRSAFDMLEGWSMTFASSIVCNSLFSCEETIRTFPQLADLLRKDVDIFYPPVNFIDTIVAPADEVATAELVERMRQRTVFVSLNRYERKKSIGLAISAFAQLLGDADVEAWPLLPLLVIAGGYDPRLPENVQYLEELRALAAVEHHIPDSQIHFMHNITDAEKTALLTHMRALVYTPSNEHFGIVPVEAMWHSKPVVAVAHGGPCESVGNIAASSEDAGGILCEATPEAFAAAMKRFGADAQFAQGIGEQGNRRARALFSIEHFSTLLVSRLRTLCDDAEEKLAAEVPETSASTISDKRN